MSISKDDYSKMTDNASPNSPKLLNCIKAFLFGGGICLFAGTIVPITGFANSVVSPALEWKHEGFVLGTAAQMFSIAGPVIVYGTASSFLYGLIIYIFKLY